MMSAGFSLLEILLAIGILSVIFAIGLPTSVDFYSSYQFDSEVNTFVSILEQARNSAMTNRNESSHGVYAAPNQFIIFQGSSYAARDISQDRIFPRDGNINISGPTELAFTSLSGQTASTTYAFNRGQRSVNVYVNSEGMVSF